MFQKIDGFLLQRLRLEPTEGFPRSRPNCLLNRVSLNSEAVANVVKGGSGAGLKRGCDLLEYALKMVGHNYILFQLSCQPCFFGGD